MVNPLGKPPHPAPAAARPQSSPPAAAGAPKADNITYTVQRGDTLSTIAARQLGSAQQWLDLFELNQDILPDPNQLKPGMVIKVASAHQAKSAGPKHSAAYRQLEQLAEKYQIPIPADTVKEQQSAIVRAVVEAAAARHGVPLSVALGVSGHESGGWQMWSKVDANKVLKGVNRDPDSGRVLSTDWGVMQINDRAHPKAFPKVKQDLEANIEFGMRYLADQHTRFKGSLGAGFGDWDKTLASYNLGHAPSRDEIAHAKRYIRAVKRWAQQAGHPPTGKASP